MVEITSVSPKRGRKLRLWYFTAILFTIDDCILTCLEFLHQWPFNFLLRGPDMRTLIWRHCHLRSTQRILSNGVSSKANTGSSFYCRVVNYVVVCVALSTPFIRLPIYHGPIFCDIELNITITKVKWWTSIELTKTSHTSPARAIYTCFAVRYMISNLILSKSVSDIYSRNYWRKCSLLSWSNQSVLNTSYIPGHLTMC